MLDLNDLKEEFQDIENEIEDLEGRISELEEDATLDTDDRDDAIGNITSDIDDLKNDRYFALESLIDDLPTYIDTLIPEDEMEDYVKRLYEDTYDLDFSDLPYNISSNISIDWEQVAHDASHDYSCIEFDGETYFYQG